MQKDRAKWVNGLDSLRFVLALIVLLSHLSDPYVTALKSSTFYPFQLAGVFINHLFPGVVAVSAFFVISGFVIHYPNKDKQNLDVIPFLVRRWVRVGIPLLAILVCSGYFGQGILSMVWSIYCELIFYTLYPLLFALRLSWKHKMYLSLAISIPLVALMIAVSTGVLHWHIFSQRNIYWQLCISFINFPIWMIGVLIADGIDDYTKSISSGMLWLARGVVYLFSMIIIFIRMHYGINSIYTCLLVAPFLGWWLRCEIVYYSIHSANRLTELAGKFSYSLYLWHLFGFLIVGKLLPLNTTTYFIYVLGAVVIAYVAYVLIEQPSHRLARWLAASISNGKNKSE